MRPCLLLMVILVSACTVGPDYRRPELDLPESYRLAPAEAPALQAIADLPWWELFDDPQLVALIEQALRENLDLRLAAAQILEAQAQLAVARAPLLPFVSGEAQASRTNQNAAGRTVESFLAALALSWELDFWGRYRRATEAARAALLATEEGRRSVLASLVAAVAQQYLELAALRQRLDIAERTASAQRESLDLVRSLAKQGVQSDAEVRQAESQLLATEAQVPGLERRVAQAENALSVLLGMPPHGFTLEGGLPRVGVSPEVPVGVPSELLERRPDVRQAEQRLVAANANVGVARALFFPRISLTGLLGRASDSLRGVVSNGRTAGSIALGASAPIFSGGEVTANYEAARARAEQAVIAYRRTVLTALQEVSDALVALDRDRREAEVNRRRVEVTRDALHLAELRFRAGVVSYLEVLDAQRQLFAAQLDLNAAQLNQRLSAVQLYRALGGGWQGRRGEEGQNQEISDGGNDLDAASGTSRAD